MMRINLSNLQYDFVFNDQSTKQESYRQITHRTLIHNYLLLSGFAAHLHEVEHCSASHCCSWSPLSPASIENEWLLAAFVAGDSFGVSKVIRTNEVPTLFHSALLYSKEITHCSKQPSLETVTCPQRCETLLIPVIPQYLWSWRIHSF